MNKQQLATKIWESANKMRSKIEAHEYKDYILGFIFYKYLSDNLVTYLYKEGYTQEDIEKQLHESNTQIVDHIRRNRGYFIAYKDLFSTWLKMGRDFDASNVTDALSAFSRLIDQNHRKVFDGVFDTLQTGLSKLGDSTGTRTKAISDLIHLIKDIPMNSKQDYDVLGFIYEYLISMFAANAGKKAGEFYTPQEVSLLISEIVANHLQDRTQINIYDPTSGSGSLLINIGRCVGKHMDDKNNIKYYAQEWKQNTYNLTRMNLVMRGILPDNIVTRNGDTLEDDWPYFDEADPAQTYDPLYVDAVVSNPPYSQHWDPENKENDPRYARFGLAPKSKADYAFLLHDLFHLKPDGIMAIVLPHGVLFRGGEEGEIRKNLIEANHIDAIIGLPANIFFGTGIPTIIMILKQRRENTDVLIVDASKDFAKVGKNNKLRASDIKRIVDAVIQRADIPRYSRKVERQVVRDNDYNLNIPRYVDSADQAETWDIYSSMFGGIPTSEIAGLEVYWSAFPRLKESLFVQNGSPYTELAVTDIWQAIEEHPSVQGYIADYMNAFEDFNSFLRRELIDNMTALNIQKEEAVISEAIFARLGALPLVDKYHAYQLLDDAWAGTSVDLEIIQTEGFTAVKVVDPNMVIKKKNGKDEEVQDGWRGHVIPFELVQQTLLRADLDALREQEGRLGEISAEQDEILDSIAEEDKTSGLFNDAGDAFVAKEVAAICREWKKAVYPADSFEDKIQCAGRLIAEAKEVTAQIKKQALELHMKTKETIENLTDEQARELLEQKWIHPLAQGIRQLPHIAVQALVDMVKALSEKYAVTYDAVETEIKETETALAALIDQLTGSEYDMKGLREFQALLGGE